MPSTAYTFDSSEISIRAKEPFLTEKINQRDFGVLAVGTYNGFNVEPNAAALTVSLNQGALAEGIALVPVSGDYLLSVRKSGISFSLSAYTSQTVVLGIVGTYTTSSTTAEIRVYTEAEYLALTNPELVVVLATVVVPAAGVIPAGNISYKYRTDAWDNQPVNAVPSISSVPGLSPAVWDDTAESNLTWLLGTRLEANVGASTPSTFTTASYVSTPIYASAYNTNTAGGFPPAYEKPWVLRIYKQINHASTTPGAGTIRARVIYLDTTYETLNLDGDVVDTGSYAELAFTPTHVISEIRIEFNGYTTTQTSTALMFIESVDLFVPRTNQSQYNVLYKRMPLFKAIFVDEDLNSPIKADMGINSADSTLDIAGVGSNFVPVKGVNGLIAGATRDTNVAGLSIESVGSSDQVLQKANYDTYEDIEFFNGVNSKVKRVNGNLTGSEDTADWTFEAVYGLASGIVTLGSRASGDAATWTAGSAPKSYVSLAGGLVWPGTSIGIGKAIGSPLDINHVYLQNIVKSKGTITANFSGSPTLAGDYNVGAVTAVTTTVTVPFDTNLPDANYTVNINILSSSGTPIYVPKVLSRAVGNFTFEIYNITSAGLYSFTATSGLVVMFTVV